MVHSLNDAALLHALLLDGRGGARELTTAELNQWQPDQGELWVHLDYTEPSAKQWLSDQALPHIAVDALTAENTRPRALNLDEHNLLIALRGVNLNANADPEDMVSVRLLLQRQRLISSRKRKLQSVITLLEALREGRGPTSLSQLIIDLSRSLIARIGDQVFDLDERLEQLEELSLGPGQVGERRESLSEFRNINSRLRRHLGPQREALIQLQADRILLLSREEKEDIREINDSLTRHIEDLDMIRERTTAAQEYLISHLSDQLNSRLYLLAIISGVFLPLGFFTGLMGVNLAGMPGSDSPAAFWIFTAVLGLISCGLLWLLKRFRWF